MAKKLESVELSESTKAHLKEASDNTVDTALGAVRGSIPGVVKAVKSGMNGISESVEAVKGLNDDLKGRTFKEQATLVKEFGKTAMQSTADSVMEKPGEVAKDAKTVIDVASGETSIRDAMDRAAEARREKAERLEKLDAERKESADERVNKKGKAPKVNSSTFANAHAINVKYAARDAMLAAAVDAGASQQMLDDIASKSAEDVYDKSISITQDRMPYVIDKVKDRMEDKIKNMQPCIQEAWNKGKAFLDGPALHDSIDGPKMPDFV